MMNHITLRGRVGRRSAWNRKCVSSAPKRTALVSNIYEKTLLAVAVISSLLSLAQSVMFYQSNGYIRKQLGADRRISSCGDLIVSALKIEDQLTDIAMLSGTQLPIYKGYGPRFYRPEERKVISFVAEIATYDSHFSLTRNAIKMAKELWYRIRFFHDRNVEVAMAFYISTISRFNDIDSNFQLDGDVVRQQASFSALNLNTEIRIARIRLEDECGKAVERLE